MNDAALHAYSGNPVAVIGNGPVGQTAALLLSRWGIPVILLDTRPQRDLVGSKAICQQRDVLDIWSSIGAEKIADGGVTWTTARTFYRDHELFEWSFVDGGHSSLPAFVNISQAETERVLDEQIAMQPLIEERWGHDVIALRQFDDRVVLHCEISEGSRELTVSYALACAGARGEKIREQLGVTFDGKSFDDRFLICDIRTQMPDWDAERRFYFDPPWNPDRQVLIHPCPDSIFRIDWQVPPDFQLDDEVANGGLDWRIRHIIGDRPYEIVWKSVYRFHARIADRMRVGRVLLAGDLAHLVAPFGARGLNSGVPDAENASWKLAFVLLGWAPDSLLDSYDSERLAAARENLEVTSQTMNFLVPQTTDEWISRRSLLEQATKSSAAQARIDSGRFAEPFWYIDSPLTTSSPRHHFTGRPTRGDVPRPVPGVLVPDAPVKVLGEPEVVRLRQLVRLGLLALVTEDVDCREVAAVLARATDAPTRALVLGEIDVEGVISQTLSTSPGEVWVIRPDGHIAAVVDSKMPDSLSHAVRRVLGDPTSTSLQAALT